MREKRLDEALYSEAIGYIVFLIGFFMEGALPFGSNRIREQEQA